MPHPGHDPHIEDDIGAVGQLDADFTERGADRPHRERDNIHCPPLHAILENVTRAPIAFVRQQPVIGRAGVAFIPGADIGQMLGAGDVIEGGAVVNAAGQFFLVELDQLAGLERFFFQPVFFRLRSVAPDDAVRFAQLGALAHPFSQFFVFGHDC